MATVEEQEIIEVALVEALATVAEGKESCCTTAASSAITSRFAAAVFLTKTVVVSKRNNVAEEVKATVVVLDAAEGGRGGYVGYPKPHNQGGEEHGGKSNNAPSPNQFGANMANYGGFPASHAPLPCYQNNGFQARMEKKYLEADCNKHRNVRRSPHRLQSDGSFLPPSQ